MVVFTCGHCGESVQKPKVEKHYLTKCRNRNPNLSCMDCFKDFLGDEYEAHIKCVTEEERYSGKGFMAKEKKGEKKQTAWVEMLQSVLDEQKSAPKNVLRIIETISKHNNTPRKKPKFYNFVKNVCGQKTGAKDIEQAWDLISVKLSALSNANAQNRNQNEKNGEEKDDNSDSGSLSDKESLNVEENGINGNIKEDDNENKTEQNGDMETDKNNGASEDKKLSKKQRKEEKKRLKYEAELQSAVAPPTDDEEDNHTNKKGKKKSKSKCVELDDQEVDDKKNKKRKRQDTANSVTEAPDVTEAVTVEAPVVKEKTERVQKKKLKVGENDDADESICLHDQNVAKIEELSMQSDKFNWHAVIMSVLEKKGNEVPFKRLQKKVLSEYAEATGRDVDDRIADKFIKKLKSAPNVRVDKNRVILVQ